MSVVIKNIDKPLYCTSCPCFDAYNDNGEQQPVCGLFGKINFPTDYPFPSWCTIIQLPKKHGRLIDANELKRNIICFNGRIPEWIEEHINNTTTILESEE